MKNVKTKNPISLFYALTLGILLMGFNTQAQRMCGTMEALAAAQQADPTLQNRMDKIEGFTNQFIQNYNQGNQRLVGVTIPVVVHVLYSSSGQNVSDAQVQAQIDVLNKDFSATNADIGSVPSAFSGLVANTGISFCLAQRDPSGNATTGIIHKSTTTTSFSSNNAVKYSAQGGDNAWDATKYLNLWVCNLGGGLLGYAQFPGGAAATDGVVVLYSSLPGGSASPYNLGRTATHEVGHWLNLRHIWGDASCGNDQVSDTPTQSTSNFGCPSYPHVTCSNGPNGDMFMNYMDYTDDACMFMFSAGQSARSNALFVSGGARYSIVSSNGCTPVGTTCTAPSGLNTTGITTTTATLNWSAVSGSTGYNVRYKATSSSTWINSSTTGTSTNISGLTEATQYEFQVQNICSGSSSSAFSASSLFTTSNGTVTCNAPTGLSATSVATTTATLNWGAVSGSTGYNVHVKPTASSTWSPFATTGTSLNITGLTANTQYEFQVQNICSGTSSSTFSASSLFTTLNTSTCSDGYESNNSITAAKSIAVNTNISALIGTSTDVDWFKFINTTANKNIKITLTNLPADYDIQLYKSNGALLKTSQNSNTTSETIVYNTTAKAATYYVKVYGYGGVYSASSCYTLNASISGTAFKEIAPEPNAKNAAAAISELLIYPNPNQGNFKLSYSTDAVKSSVMLNIFDLSGRIIYNEMLDINGGSVQKDINLNNITSGIYIVEIDGAGDRIIQKLVINN